MWAGLCDSFPKYSAWRVKNSDFTEIWQTDTILTKNLKVNTTSDKLCEYTSWYDAMRGVLHLCGIPQTHNPSLIFEKIRKNSI